MSTGITLNGEQVVAVIPARGGSKSVPGKNIGPLGGKPLLGSSIEVARQLCEIDRIIVSTDDAEIASVGNSGGAEVYTALLEKETKSLLMGKLGGGIDARERSQDIDDCRGITEGA
ncbi:MAG: hypothetical protein WAM85_01230 [Terracidiphilus sp.]